MKNETRVYHKDSGFPHGMQRPIPGNALRYSAHALNEAGKDNVFAYLPGYLPEQFTLIEATCVDINIPVCWVVRFPMSRLAEKDLVLVVNTDYSVRTAWVNRRTDNHKTLDRSRYTVPCV